MRKLMGTVGSTIAVGSAIAVAFWCGACRVTLEKDSDKGKSDAGSATAGKDNGGGSGKAGEGGAAGGSKAGSGSGASGTKAGAGGAGNAGQGAMAAGPSCEGVAELTPKLTLMGDINSEMHLSGVIAVARSIDVVASVTIDPGTVFVMAADTSIEFGWNSNTATITASGTSDKPIRFCGKQSKPGYWVGVSLASGVTTDSLFEHVLVSDAGQSEAALSIEKAVKVTDVRVRNSLKDGVSAAAFASGSSGLWVDGAGRDAVVLTTPVAVNNFPASSMFTGNTNNLARLTFGNIESDTKFSNIGIPYLQAKNVDVYAVKLTYAAGVEVRFAADTDFEIGWNTNKATLSVEGTSSSPVVFRGEKETKGFYKSIIVQDSVTTDSKISNLRVSHAGGSDAAAFTIAAGITVEDLTLTDNKTALVINAKLKAGSKNISVSGSDAYPLSVSRLALADLPKGGQFMNNATNQVLVNGGYTNNTGTVSNLGIPYFVKGDISMENGAALDIEPGVTFVMDSMAVWEVAWNSGSARLSAAGSADKPVVFRGKDDTRGSWGGLVYRGSASSESKLDHVEIKNAGLKLERAVPVTNSSFSNSATYGISKSASDITDYMSTNTFSDNASGTVGNY